jgi:hypothetical protein
MGAGVKKLECGCGATTSTYKGVVVHWHGPDSTAHVVRATPEATFANDMICTVGMKKHPYCRLESDKHACTDESHHPVGQQCFTGWLLHIDADQHLVYRIGDYIWITDEWEGRWPD